VPGAVLAPLAPAKHMGLVERHQEFDAIVAAFIDAQASVQRSA
jgi:hypothetical protein